jgi:hypothetical protein
MFKFFYIVTVPMVLLLSFPPAWGSPTIPSPSWVALPIAFLSLFFLPWQISKGIKSDGLRALTFQLTGTGLGWFCWLTVLTITAFLSR